MKTVASFKVEARERTGKGAARAVRRQNKIPAVIYGNGVDSTSIALDEKDFLLFYQKGGIFNKLVDIQLNGKTYHVLPRVVETHPVSDKPEHVDFLNVTESSIIRVSVPVRIKGLERCIGVKRGGVLNIVRHEIDLLCKPGDILSNISIDVSELNIGDTVHIDQIELPANVKPAITTRNFTIVSVAGRGSDEDEAAATAAAATAAAAAEGAAPAAAGAPAAPGSAPAAAAKPAAGKGDKK